jgi:hypothetical protein
MFLNLIPKGMNVSYPLLLLTFFFLVVERRFRKEKVINLDVVTISWLGIFALGVLTIAKWHNMFFGLQWFMALSIIPFVLWVLVSNEYITDDGIKWILERGIPFLFCVIVIETIFDFIKILIAQDTIFNIFNIMIFRRLTIPNNGSNRLADMLVFISVFGFTSAQLWKGKWIKNNSMNIIITISLVMSFLIMSRGALIALLVSILAYVWGQFQIKKEIKILPIVLSLSTVLVIMKPFVDKLIFRMQHLVDLSTLFRFILWNDSIIQIKNSIIGTGPGQYIYKVMTEQHDDPHNLFLRYGVEFGGISIVFLSIIIITLFYAFIRQYKKNKNIAMAIYMIFIPPILGTFVHGQMDYVISSRSYGPFFWLIWSMAMHIISNEEKAKKLLSINYALPAYNH